MQTESRLHHWPLHSVNNEPWQPLDQLPPRVYMRLIYYEMFTRTVSASDANKYIMRSVLASDVTRLCRGSHYSSDAVWLTFRPRRTCENTTPCVSSSLMTSCRHHRCLFESVRILPVRWQSVASVSVRQRSPCAGFSPFSITWCDTWLYFPICMQDDAHSASTLHLATLPRTRSFDRTIKLLFKNQPIACTVARGISLVTAIKKTPLIHFLAHCVRWIEISSLDL